MARVAKVMVDGKTVWARAPGGERAPSPAPAGIAWRTSLREPRADPQHAGQCLVPSTTADQRRSINAIWDQFRAASNAWEAAGSVEGSREHIAYARAQSWFAWFMWFLWEDHAFALSDAIRAGAFLNQQTAV